MWSRHLQDRRHPSFEDIEEVGHFHTHKSDEDDFDEEELKEFFPHLREENEENLDHVFGTADRAGSVHDHWNGVGRTKKGAVYWVFQDHYAEIGTRCNDDDVGMMAASGGAAPSCAAAATFCQDTELGLMAREHCPRTCNSWRDAAADTLDIEHDHVAVTHNGFPPVFGLPVEVLEPAPQHDDDEL